MMEAKFGGANKALARRGDFWNKALFTGKGLDVGGGHDSLAEAGYDAYNWDLKDGDAQYLEGVKANTYDFVHSSHCLEHMKDPVIALENWIRVCKPNGYITIVIPDEELYEHNFWPSRFNSDHKWSFRMYKRGKKLPNSIDLLEFLKKPCISCELIRLERIETGFDWDLASWVDQTAQAPHAECSIEFILRKK
jgi:SAM-dependent methyltransferase